MRLHPLPAPDFLEYTLPEGHCSLITDDGSRTSLAVAEILAQQGWPVVLLRFPANVVASQPRGELPAGVAHVTLESMTESDMQVKVAAITAEHGPAGAFIHLHPAFDAGATLFEGRERAIVKQIFLMAKHLQPALTGAAAEGRAVFMSVTRLDGALGLGGGEAFGAIGGGLPGLVKSLNLEWAQVFCRAVDLAPSIMPERAAQLVRAELHDPNRLIVEVGHGPQGRVTLTDCSSPKVHREDV